MMIILLFYVIMKARKKFLYPTKISSNLRFAIFLSWFRKLFYNPSYYILHITCKCVFFYMKHFFLMKHNNNIVNHINLFKSCCDVANIFQIINITLCEVHIVDIYMLAFLLSHYLRSFSVLIWTCKLTIIYLFLASFIFAKQTDERRTVRRPRKINSIDFDDWQWLDTLVYRADGCQLYSIMRAWSNWWASRGVASDTYMLYIGCSVFVAKTSNIMDFLMNMRIIFP